MLAVTLLALGIATPALLSSVGCQQVPITNRKQLLVTSVEKENEMGLTAYQEVLKSEPVTKNEKATEMVRRVGQRIADAANRPDFKWEFNVIESETQNAFCLPGGKVMVENA
jgi:predicted Zn-dependent protease